MPVARTEGRLTARHVLIVDDVITTGETGRQIAQLALANGADKVSMLAIARASPRAVPREIARA